MEIIIKPPLRDHWVIDKHEKGSQEGFSANVFISDLEDTQIVKAPVVYVHFISL